MGRGSGGFTEPIRIVLRPGEPAGELYNLRKDPHEDLNVYTANPRIVERLAALLKKYRDNGSSR